MKGNLSKRKGLLSEITEKHLSQIVNSLKEKVLSVLVLKEDVANKVTSLSADSTDIEYPSAKAVYEIKKALSEQVETELEDIKLTKEDVANKVTEITEDSADTAYPSAKAVFDLIKALEDMLSDNLKKVTPTICEDIDNVPYDTGWYISPDKSACVFSYNLKTYQKPSISVQPIEAQSTTNTSQNEPIILKDEVWQIKFTSKGEIRHRYRDLQTMNGSDDRWRDCRFSPWTVVDEKGNALSAQTIDERVNPSCNLMYGENGVGLLITLAPSPGILGGRKTYLRIDETGIAVGKYGEIDLGGIYTDGYNWNYISYTKEETDEKLSAKEDIANKVTEITEDSTDTGYPSSKAVKDYAQPKESGKGLSSNDFTDGFKIKLENIDENANNYILPDDVVKNTDYAAQTKGGVVKINPSTGVKIYADGALGLQVASATEISSRDMHTTKAIVPKILNRAVKAALSDANRISDMTDEEKTNARGVIGAAAEDDCEKTANKVTTITDASTDSQYPSAKAVYLYTIDTAISLSEHINQKEDAFERELLTQASCDVALSNKKDVRCFTTATDITLTTPMVSAITSEEEWECYLSFKSGETPTSLAYSATPIKWVGVDCDADGDFIPSANTNYEISVRTVNKDSSGKAIIVARVGVY